MHDVPPAVRAELEAAGEPTQAPDIFDQPFPLDAWPSIPTHVIACTRDRLFPESVIDRTARDRLGVEPERLDCGHLAGFARPDELAEALLRQIAIRRSR
jgi:pimeloyl-ACP methyl ester carboxylesterase